MNRLNVQSNSGKLKGRSREIYAELDEYLAALPEGCPLPPLRELQKRFQAGQQTVVNAIDQLDRENKVTRLRRKGIRAARRPAAELPAAAGRERGAVSRRTAVLRMLPFHLPVWEPLVRAFNAAHPDRPIEVECRVEPDEFSRLDKDAACDFLLFPNTPTMVSPNCHPLQFLDLSELSSTLDHVNFHAGVRVVDPMRRVFGIAPTLTTAVLWGRPEYLAGIDSEAWSWEEFAENGRALLGRNPRLQYAGFLDGYIHYLFHSGCRFSDPGTGQLHFDYERMAGPLELLRRMTRDRVLPIFSDMYRENRQWELFRGGELALMEISSGIGGHESCDFDPVPAALPTARGVPYTLASEQFCIRAASLKYESCWEFIRFSLGEECQRHLARRQRCLPVRRRIFQGDTPTPGARLCDRLLDRGERVPEDFFFPLQARYILEVGIDQWLKMGGDLMTTLQSLEQSCRWQVDQIKRSQP